MSATLFGDTRPTSEPDDVHGATRALGVPAPLEPLHDAGVLDNADVHVATRLWHLTGAAARAEDEDLVLVGFALAVRAMRNGHVAVDLASADLGVADVEVEALARVHLLPRAELRGAVSASPGVLRARHVGTDRDDGTHPFVLDRDSLYLRRLYDARRRVVEGVLERVARPPDPPSSATRAAVRRVLAHPTGGSAQEQQAAALVLVERGFAVLAGGPGTGKTHTVGGIVAVVDERWRATEGRAPRVALAAPTGKAARRMGEALREWLDQGPDVEPATADHLRALEPMTLHRLLGRHRGSTAARRDATAPLPADLVVVDEASMADVVLLGQLLDALAPETALLLVGDPAQLRSVEAGTVLADLVGPRLRDPRARASDDGTPRSRVHEVVHVLTHTHRFDARKQVGAFSRAVLAGDDDAAMEVLRRSTRSAADGTLAWIDHDVGLDGVDVLRPLVTPAAVATHAAAEAGDPDAALRGVASMRLLAAHRRGPWGVARLDAAVDRWLRAEADVADGVGVPLLVGRPHRRERLDNGDLGVAVRDVDHRPVAVFGGGRRIGLGRLDTASVVHAMTIHRVQGSQFEQVVVALPTADARLMTRELLYTAVTRARARVTLVGTETMVRAAVTRMADRAGSLRAELWDRTPTLLA